MANELIVDEIRRIADWEDVPVWGIGPASRMADERPGHRPEDLLPGAESLICLGIPVPRGVYDMPTYGVETVWRSQNILYRRLDELSARIAALLEERGAQSVPLYGCMPLGVNKKGVIVGYLNQIRMGEVIGIGVIGKNGMLLHSHYGARLMLGGVLTTQVLPEIRHPDLRESGCAPDCRLCVEACPVDAILPAQKQVKVMRCLGYTARTPAMSKLKFSILRTFNPDAAARYLSLTSFDEHTFHICSRCVAECPYSDQLRSG